MYATVTLSYFTYVERHEDIISTRTSSETLIKKYLSIEQKLCLFFLLFFPPVKPKRRAGLLPLTAVSSLRISFKTSEK